MDASDFGADRPRQSQAWALVVSTLKNKITNCLEVKASLDADLAGDRWKMKNKLKEGTDQDDILHFNVVWCMDAVGLLLQLPSSYTHALT